MEYKNSKPMHGFFFVIFYFINIDQDIQKVAQNKTGKYHMDFCTPQIWHNFKHFTGTFNFNPAKSLHFLKS